MKAAVISGGRSLEIVRNQPPRPAAGEVRVRLEGCGVCASNLPIWQGRPWVQYPLPAGEPGHEGWGIVDEVGEERGGEAGELTVRRRPLQRGDRVTFLSTRAYAEYDITRTDHCVRIPEQLSGKPMPGEALGCAINIFQRAEITAGQTVVIVGAGFIGNVLIQLSDAAKARVIAVSRRASALEVATLCGASAAIPMTDAENVEGVVSELTRGTGADRVIECVGAQLPLDIATKCVARRGRLVIAGYHQDGPRVVDMRLWNWLGIDVVNAHERDSIVDLRGIQEGMALVASGSLDLDRLLTNTYALDELGRALDDVAERPSGFLKGMIVF